MPKPELRRTIVESADRVARVLAAVDAGELEAPAETRLRLEGAHIALRGLLANDRPPSYNNGYTDTGRLLYDGTMSPRGTKVVGYVRVSTAEQADSGAGLEAQRRAITDACERKGWVLVTILEDRGVSAKSTKGRPSLAAAVSLVEAGGAQALVVAKLDRLSRSILDFSTLMERASSNGWAIVVLDMDFDMTSPTGELMANMLASFAQFERRLISQRTKDGLAVKRSEGVQLGRKSTLDERTVARIGKARVAGMSLAAIARALNDDAIPTGQGGKRWYPSSVKAVLDRI